jgi:hypothetical protein
MVNSDNEVQVLKNGGRKPSVSRPVSPASGNAANGQGSESSEDEREGSTLTINNRTVGPVLKYIHF